MPHVGQQRRVLPRTTMKPKEWNARLEPFASICAEAEGRMEDIIKDMSADDLRALIEASTHPTQTNCGWATYQVCERVRGMARYWLRRAEEEAAAVAA